MADNVTLNAGSGGDTIAADEISGAKYQRIKLVHGPDGTNEGDVSTVNPLPVAFSGYLQDSAAAQWDNTTATDEVFATGAGFRGSLFLTATVAGTITAGVLTFEARDSNNLWYPIHIKRLDAYTTDASYTLGTGQEQAWQVDCSSYKEIRVRLSTPISGAGHVDIAATVSVATTTGPQTVGQSDASKLNATVQISDGGNTADVTASSALKVDGSAVTQPVSDGGGSLTVDGSVGVASVPAPLSTTGGGTEAAALRVTLASDSTGLVSVDDNGGSLTVDGTVTADGGAAHDASVSGNPNLIAGRSSAAAPASVDADGDAVTLWALRNGALATVLTAAGALVGGDASNGLDVDVTRLPALAAGTNNIGDVDVLTVPAPLSTTGGGTEAAALRVTVATDSTGVLSVDDNGGSLTVDGTVTASNAAGDVAHGAGDSGNPIKVGGKAANAFPTAEANGDRVNMITDLFGRQMMTHIDPAQFVWKSFNATTSQTGADVWSPTSGKRIAIVAIVISVYGTTAGRLLLWFGDNADTTYTAGTDQLVVPFSAAPSASSKPGLVFVPQVPIFCNTADRELHITTDANMSVDVAVCGYEY